MPASSVKTKQTNVRLPVDLIEWIATQDGSQADVIVRSLRSMKGDGDGLTLLPVPGVVAELEAKVASLTKERDIWVKVAKAATAALPTSNAEGRRLARGHDPMGRSAHQSGPLLASAVPEGLTETVKPFFRNQPKQKGAKQ